MPNCELCGEPMPNGEEMFRYHGNSGPCQKPPMALSLYSALLEINRLKETLKAADHTLSIHGKIDANTPLHERIRDGGRGPMKPSD